MSKLRSYLSATSGPLKSSITLYRKLPYMRRKTWEVAVWRKFGPSARAANAYSLPFLTFAVGTADKPSMP